MLNNYPKLQIEYIIAAAYNGSQHELRDATMLLFMYKFGLNTKQLLNLCWDQVNLDLGLLYPGGGNMQKFDLIHPLFNSELRALREIKSHYANSQYIFVSEDGAPLTVSSFNEIVKMVAKKANVTLNPKLLSEYRLKYILGSGKEYA